MDRQVVSPSQVGYRSKPDLLIGVVIVGSHSNDIFLPIDERLETFITDFMVGEDGDSHL